MGQLLVYRFGAAGRLRGPPRRGAGAHRAGGTLRVLDVPVRRLRRRNGEVFAIDLHGSSPGGMVAAAVGFRLDVAERRRSTRKALARTDGLGALIRDARRAARSRARRVMAVLVGHEWARVLADAVERTGGTAVANAFVTPTSLGALAPDLLAAVGGGSARSAEAAGGPTSTSPSRTAHSAACVRELRPSFARMFETCVRAVRSLSQRGRDLLVRRGRRRAAAARRARAS